LKGSFARRMTYGPKSEGVPKDSLGSGGRLMSVGPAVRDMVREIGGFGFLLARSLKAQLGTGVRRNQL